MSGSDSNKIGVGDHNTEHWSCAFKKVGYLF